VRREGHRCIEPEVATIRPGTVRIDPHEKRPRQSCAIDLRSDAIECAARVRQMLRPPDQEQRPIFVAHVSTIRESACQETPMRFVILGGMLLRHQNLSRFPGPSSTPRLVRPAKAEREVGGTRAQYFIKRSIEQAAAAKPIVVIAESVDAVRPGKISLRLPNFRHAQITEPKIRRELWLIVAPEERSRFRYVGPLGKSGSPPGVVLWNRVKLRKVERDRARLDVVLHVRDAPAHALRGEDAAPTSDRVRQGLGAARPARTQNPKRNQSFRTAATRGFSCP
jgi:hypothetical protein